jgi:hypothetical protein
VEEAFILIDPIPRHGGHKLLFGSITHSSNRVVEGSRWGGTAGKGGINNEGIWKGRKGARPCFVNGMTAGRPITVIAMAMRDQLSCGTVARLPEAG